MRFGTMAAAALAAVLVLPGCRKEPMPANETARTASQAVDDGWISTKIEAKYFASPQVKGRHIDVSTTNGVVTLTGAVSTDQAKQEAVSLARSTDGVRDVQDRLTIAPAGEVATTGTEKSPPVDRDAGRAAERAGETVASTVGSAWTTTKIQAKYFVDPDVKGHNIDVTTHDGVVTLAGRVDNETQHLRALQIARDTDGVKDVRDQLRIAPAAANTTAAPAATPASPAAPTLTDADLVARVQSKFYLNDDLRQSTIDVTATNGVVTLSGTVASDARKHDALDVARSTDGVADVKDDLHVSAEVQPLPGGAAAKAEIENAKTAAADEWITTKIQARYYIDPDIKGRNIDVSTNKGIVTLSGTVGSETMRDQALSIARNTEGVTKVIDRLMVSTGGDR